jgi:hypothetical protein
MADRAARGAHSAAAAAKAKNKPFDEKKDFQTRFDNYYNSFAAQLGSADAKLRKTAKQIYDDIRELYSARYGESATTQPTDTQPADTQPAESQPAESQPAESQPAETGPEETMRDVKRGSRAALGGETGAQRQRPRANGVRLVTVSTDGH